MERMEHLLALAPGDRGRLPVLRLVHDHPPFLSEMPHGGFKESGYGKDLSVYALDDYSRVKHAMVKLG